MDSPIILHIISGFLGAGKTTFIQAMLQEFSRRNRLSVQPEKIVYVVNEFGKSGVDASIMDNQSYASFELANGCICCTLKTEFSLLLHKIIEEQKPDRIIFEPSGLFILSELFPAIAGASFSSRLQIGSVVTLIDARYDQVQRQAFSPVLLNQSSQSDLLVISKLHDQPEKTLDRLLELQDHYRGQPMLTRDVWDFTSSDWAEIIDRPVRSLHQVRLESTRRLVRENLLWTRQHPQLNSITTRIQPDTSQLEITSRLQELVKGEAGEIIRAKGFVRCDGQNWLIQVVCREITWHMAHQASQANQDGEQRLTIIGNSLQPDKIRSILE